MQRRWSFCICFLSLLCMHDTVLAQGTLPAAGEKTDTMLVNLLRVHASPLLQRVLDHPDSFRYQLIYTRIDRDRQNHPHFHPFYYRVNPLEYFNPASTVKMPLALLALEKMKGLSKYGIDKYSPMLTDSGYSGQRAAHTDSSAADGLPSLAQYIKKIFLVSDNDAYNRLYEFLGQEWINLRLREMGYPGIRITRRFVPMSEEENRHTNPIRFLEGRKYVAKDGSTSLEKGPGAKAVANGDANGRAKGRVNGGAKAVAIKDAKEGTNKGLKEAADAGAKDGADEAAKESPHKGVKAVTNAGANGEMNGDANRRVTGGVKGSANGAGNPEMTGSAGLAGAKVAYSQPGAESHFVFDFGRSVLIGQGHFDRNDSLVHTPMDFTRHNNVPLEDLQQILQSVLFPESIPPARRFDLAADDYPFLYRYMSQYPREETHPQYDTTEFFDSYTKFFLFKAGRTPIPATMRIFNKPGWSYGFLTDVAYLVDFAHHVEFMLSGVIYVNRDGILNDDKYEYEETGYPFFKEVGEIIYRYELGRTRAYVPDLGKFKISYDGGPKTK